MSDFCEKGDDCPWIQITKGRIEVAEEKTKSLSDQFNLFKRIVYVLLGAILTLTGYDTIKQEKYMIEIERLSYDQKQFKKDQQKILDKLNSLVVNSDSIVSYRLSES
jgi:hypothetical protein